MFSKFAKNKNDDTAILTWADFYNKKVDLKKLKMPELKEISRRYKLRLTGTKPILMDNISHFFNLNRQAGIIQRVLRGRFVRYCIMLQGAGLKNRKLCVNDTDFYSLEPLVDIPNVLFFSYTDEKKFTYGFNIESLIAMIRRQGKNIINPYNREPFDIKIIQNILRVWHLMSIVYSMKECLDENVFANPLNMNSPVAITTQNNLAYDVNNIFNINRIQNSLQPRSAILAKIINIRNNPLERRIRDVFIEIDLLGNYTQSAWFYNLDRLNYYRLYQYISYIWLTSGMLTHQIKREICPFFDPLVFQVQYRMCPSSPNTTVNEAREFCLSIIENFVYGGVDIEYRRIAVLHILSALTMVSIPARNNMIWLYESLSSNIPR